ncbi:MAG: matrixin family metalloprotease [Propionibacteriales bacterium]|nr:matrixin family metalloprotease [Propionibacteriales bacterium]
MSGQVDRTGLIAGVVALAAAVGMVVAVPSLLPSGLRDVVGLGPERFADAPDPSGTGPYAFLATQAGDPDVPVGYDPCQRIPLRVNLAGAPPGSLELVMRAIAIVEGATGLRFDYRGQTGARPRWEGETVPVILGQPKASPVLVSWATADEVDALAGRVAGVGGSVAVPDGGGIERYVTGGITLDSEAFAEIDATDDGRADQLAILLHEFGHLVGLDHVDDRGELMNAVSAGRTSYGPGDLRGLAAVGSIDCG